MLWVFNLDVNALLDPGATLYVVICYIEVIFNVSQENLSETLSISIPSGDPVTDRGHREIAMSQSLKKVSSVDFVELKMVDIILGID